MYRLQNASIFNRPIFDLFLGFNRFFNVINHSLSVRLFFQILG